MITMYDSTNPLDIPVDAPAVAGYVDGKYAWSDSGWSRFRTDLRLDITVFGNAADVLDVENGDATPDQAVSWARLMRQYGYPYPGVYCNMNAWPTVKATFDAHQVDQPWYWIADYDGRPDIPAGAVAKQYQDASASGGHFDLSVVSEELITYMTSGGKRMLSPDDISAVAEATAVKLLNWPITTTTKPQGSSGRPVWDVLGDGERIRADLMSDSSMIEDLVKALPSGSGPVDPAALAAALAAPLASLLTPAIAAAETTPAEFFTALAAQLSK